MLQIHYSSCLHVLCVYTNNVRCLSFRSFCALVCTHTKSQRPTFFNCSIYVPEYNAGSDTRNRAAQSDREAKRQNERQEVTQEDSLCLRASSAPHTHTQNSLMWVYMISSSPLSWSQNPVRWETYRNCELDRVEMHQWGRGMLCYDGRQATMATQHHLRDILSINAGRQADSWLAGETK